METKEQQIEKYLNNFNDPLKSEISLFLTNSNLDHIQKLELIKLMHKCQIDALNDAYLLNLK